VSVEHLLRRDLAALEPYPPPPTIEMLEERLGRPVVKLDANENPYGPSPRVHEALSRCNVERYPDAGCTRLRELLGAFLPTDPERIVCTVGGDELLDLITRLFLEPGNEAIDCTPSFAMYHVTARANGGRVVDVPRGEGFAVDLDGVLRALTDRTKIIFLCSPNNPTGNPTPRAHIERLLETDRILVLDEAYAEFAGRTLVPLAERYRNLVVLRTMSKWAALAGIRLGYAVMDPLLIAEMTKLKAPYNVSSAAQAAGIASLEDAGYLMGNVRRIVEERERLFSRLQALPYGHVYPSETNFLYWRLPFGNARAWRDAMMERGVLIRALRKPVQALRFSVGLREESEALLAALEEVHALMAEGVEAHG
jgi:histidinol-phosphate aminotransferase